jgi:hypothetical protein
LIAYNFDDARGLQEVVAFAIADLGGELPVARDVEPIGRARFVLLD